MRVQAINTITVAKTMVDAPATKAHPLFPLQISQPVTSRAIAATIAGISR